MDKLKIGLDLFDEDFGGIENDALVGLSNVDDHKVFEASWFLDNVIVNLLVQRKKVCLFVLEGMPKAHLFRITSLLSGISYNDLISCNLNKKESEVVKIITKFFNEYITIHSLLDFSISMKDITEKIDKDDCELVLVDYPELLEEDQNVVVSCFKNFAIENKIPFMFPLKYLSKTKDKSSIERFVDVIFTINETDAGHKKILKLTKYNRYIPDSCYEYGITNLQYSCEMFKDQWTTPKRNKIKFLKNIKK